MLSAKNLSVSFGARRIMDDVSFALSNSDKAGLVGANGAGKTTLLRVLAGEIQPDCGSIQRPKHGDICYVPQQLTIPEGEELSALDYVLEGRNLVSLNARLAELEKALEKKPTRNHENEYLHLRDLYVEKEGYRAEDDAMELLTGLDLDSIGLDQQVNTLSGGQKTRLALTRMLFMQSSILLLDEPTNHIDESALVWLTTHLKKSGATMIIVSHLSTFLDDVANKIMHIEDTTLRTYPGNYTNFVMLAAQAAKHREARRKRVVAEIAHQEEFIRNASQSRATQKHERMRKVEELKAEAPTKEKRQRVMDLRFPVKRLTKDILISARDLGMSFGHKVLFDHLNITVGPSDHVLVDGPNGAGKTTLLRILAKAINPNVGEIRHSKSLDLGWYQQEQEGLNESSTILEEVLSVAIGMPSRNLRSMLAHFLFPASMVNQKVFTLSRGERARLALCKIMLSGSNLLLLDEPTNHLDRKSKEQLIQALTKYEGAMVLVTHDQELVAAISVTRTIRIKEGSYTYD